MQQTGSESPKNSRPGLLPIGGDGQNASRIGCVIRTLGVWRSAELAVAKAISPQSVIERPYVEGWDRIARPVRRKSYLLAAIARFRILTWCGRLKGLHGYAHCGVRRIGTENVKHALF